MDLKKFLKALKLNESSISMILGALVIVVVGVLVVNYVRDNKGLLPGGGLTTTQSTPKTHQVAQGETLWGISEKYYGTGYSWVQIAETNSLQSPDLIETDQTLTLPEAEVGAAAVSPEPTKAPSPSGLIAEATTYTVVKGDHLWGIAVRAYGDGYKWVEIARVNNLKNPNLLFVDTVLTLPR